MIDDTILRFMLSSISPHSGLSCVTYRDCLKSKWVIIASSIGIILSLFILSLGANNVFGPVNTAGFISSLSGGSALIATSIGLIIANLVLLRKSEYYPVIFNRDQLASNCSSHEIHNFSMPSGFPLAPLKEIHSFSCKTKKSKISNYTGPFSITTANVGMLPSAISFFQQIEHAVIGLFKKQKAILHSPSKRAPAIAKKLAEEANAVAIVCCQEVFDGHSSDVIADTLAKQGYNVLHHIKGSDLFVDSGLLFATRYPICKAGVRFWQFTNLTQSDMFSTKGLLRVPMTIRLESGTCLKIVIYTTHLQAHVSEKHVRKEQLKGILSLISQDHAEDCSQTIFLVGDLNISDYEHDGTCGNEYSENQDFFSQFQDFLQAKYVESTNLHKPNGTYYNMDAFGTGQTMSHCLYDRILLYTGGKNLLSCEYSIAIRTFLENKLSDHLPVTLNLQFNEP